MLEALDQHNFDRVEANSSLDSLYHRVFSSVHCKDNGTSVRSPLLSCRFLNDYTFLQNMIGDEPVVNLLCEWAVSTQRTGEHRAIVVAKLLEKRQNELASEVSDLLLRVTNCFVTLRNSPTPLRWLTSETTR